MKSWPPPPWIQSNDNQFLKLIVNFQRIDKKEVCVNSFIYSTQNQPAFNPNSTQIQPKTNPKPTQIQPKFNPRPTQSQPKFNPNSTLVQPIILSMQRLSFTGMKIKNSWKLIKPSGYSETDYFGDVSEVILGFLHAKRWMIVSVGALCYFVDSQASHSFFNSLSSVAVRRTRRKIWTHFKSFRRTLSHVLWLNLDDFHCFFWVFNQILTKFRPNKTVQIRKTHFSFCSLFCLPF